MKKIFFIASILVFQNSFSQTAQNNYQNCLNSINDQEIKANKVLEDKWYEDNPDPKKLSFKACDDHCPKFECIRHHKQCMNECNCYQQYQKEGQSISNRFEILKKQCEDAYKQGLAIEQVGRLTEEFNNKLKAVQTVLNTIKSNDPDKAANYENTHGLVISQIKTNYQTEVNKGSKSDQQKLRDYIASLDKEKTQLEQISEVNVNKKNSQVTHTADLPTITNTNGNGNNLLPNSNSSTINSTGTLTQYNGIMNGYNAKLKNIQLDYERNSATLNLVGNLASGLLSQYSNKKLERDLATLNDVQEKEEAVDKASDIAGDSAFSNYKTNNYEQAMYHYKNAYYFKLLTHYNRWRFIHGWFDKSELEHENKYFPYLSPILLFKWNKKNTNPDLVFANLPAIEKFVLPDLFQIPICRVSGNDKLNTKEEYLIAFRQLISCEKCKNLDLGQMGNYKIECKGQEKVSYSEDSAKYFLRKAILDKQVSNPVDFINFSCSSLWYLSLNLKSAKTMDDLNEGLIAGTLYYSVINKFVSGNFEKITLNNNYELNDYDYKAYVEFSEMLINYYLIFYYQIISENIKDEKIKKWAAEKAKLLYESSFKREEVKGSLESSSMTLSFK